MQPIKNIIDNHNKRLLSYAPQRSEKVCNCRDKKNCPLNGNCLQREVVYQAIVNSDSEIATYVGVTENEFKTRFRNHKSSFTHRKYSNQTELSKHIWKLKDSNRDFNIKWNILGKATSYSNTTKRCNLCLLEKYYIICHPNKSTLNQKSELVNTCRHRAKYKLSNT
jgi:predicted GIY-YIG superfamily endonuclease